MASGKVDWYGKHVMVVAAGASDEILAKLALVAEGVAKSNASVDTGFMRNAIYSITPGSSGRAAAVSAAKGTADRVLLGAPAVGEHEAAVHAAAAYTIYQEQRVGFLYGGMEAAARESGGVIQQVGRGRF